MAASARLVVLIDPEQKRKLEAAAKDENVSVAEIARRRISGEGDANEQAFMEALVDLGQRAEDASRRFDARLARDVILEDEADRRVEAARSFIDGAIRSGTYTNAGALIDAALADAMLTRRDDRPRA